MIQKALEKISKICYAFCVKHLLVQENALLTLVGAQCCMCWSGMVFKRHACKSHTFLAFEACNLACSINRALTNTAHICKQCGSQSIDFVINIKETLELRYSLFNKMPFFTIVIVIVVKYAPL